MLKESDPTAIRNQLQRIERKMRKRYFPELKKVKIALSSSRKWYARSLMQGYRMKFSLEHYLESSWREIEGTMKHELLHFQLAHEGLPSTHTLEFGRRAVKIGAPFMTPKRYHIKCPKYGRWVYSSDRPGAECREEHGCKRCRAVIKDRLASKKAPEAKTT